MAQQTISEFVKIEENTRGSQSIWHRKEDFSQNYERASKQVTRGLVGAAFAGAISVHADNPKVEIAAAAVVLAALWRLACAAANDATGVVDPLVIAHYRLTEGEGATNSIVRRCYKKISYILGGG